MSNKITQEEFIKRCKDKHNNFYKYDSVVYINMGSKIEIFCPFHGSFFQRAQNHLIGIGCSSCSGNKKITKDELIGKSANLYGKTFDYSLSTFERKTDVIKIIHHKFGVFSQRLDTHMRGKLPDRIKCLMSIENIIDKFKSIDCYGYINNNSNIFNVECSKHGWFEVDIRKTRNIKNIECNLCKLKNKIEFLIETHGDDRYDYSLINELNFKTTNSKLPIVCKKHGIFYQKLNNHLYSNHGCPKCNGGIILDLSEISKRTTYEVIDYKDGFVSLECKSHGVFKKRVSKLDQGCPKCGNKSIGEKAIMKYLTNKKIVYKEQFKFDECKYKRRLPFDFYLPELNMCIEYDGIHHYDDIFGELELVKTRDNIKNIFCEENKIRLLRISYLNFYDIKNILDKELI